MSNFSRKSNPVTQQNHSAHQKSYSRSALPVDEELLKELGGAVSGRPSPNMVTNKHSTFRADDTFYHDS